MLEPEAVVEDVADDVEDEPIGVEDMVVMKPAAVVEPTGRSYS